MNDMGKPAYPMNGQPGVSKREYAAIKLRVPDSGNDLLDAMIRESRRLDYAGQALAGMFASPARDCAPRGAARESLAYADAMLTAIETQRARGKPEPETDWPALPEGLPSLPEGYVYVGKGGELEASAPFHGIMFHFNIRWGAPCFGFIGNSTGEHYAVHHSDLHKIKRVRNEP